MNEKQRKCEHYFEMPRNWRSKVYFSGDAVYTPVFCNNCGLKAEEMFAYSNRFSLDGEEVVEGGDN